MSSRQRTNWALSGVVLLLLVVAYLEFHNPQVNLKSLLELEPHEIQRIQISRPDTKPILLERSAGHWKMSSPNAAMADERRINALLGIAGAPVYRRFSLAAADPEVYGLKSPQVSLWLNQTRIDFGSTEPVNHRRYVKIDDHAALIDDRILHHLLAPISSFIRPDSTTD